MSLQGSLMAENNRIPVVAHYPWTTFEGQEERQEHHESPGSTDVGNKRIPVVAYYPWTTFEGQEERQEDHESPQRCGNILQRASASESAW